MARLWGRRVLDGLGNGKETSPACVQTASEPEGEEQWPRPDLPGARTQVLFQADPFTLWCHNIHSRIQISRYLYSPITGNTKNVNTIAAPWVPTSLLPSGLHCPPPPPTPPPRPCTHSFSSVSQPAALRGQTSMILLLSPAHAQIPWDPRMALFSSPGIYQKHCKPTTHPPKSKLNYLLAKTLLLPDSPPQDGRPPCQKWTRYFRLLSVPHKAIRLRTGLGPFHSASFLRMPLWLS